MKNIAFFILLWSFCSSCKMQKKALSERKKMAGTYEWGLRNTSAQIILRLDSNYKFTYRYNEELLELISEGTWTVTSDNLILNSNSINGYNGQAKEIDSAELTKSILVFKNPSGKPYTGLKVMINNMTFNNDSLGKIELPQKINYVYLKFLTDFQFYYQPHSKTANFYEFILYPQSGAHIFFINEALKYEKKKLIDSKGHQLKKLISHH